jgi:hypothetical protein
MTGQLSEEKVGKGRADHEWPVREQVIAVYAIPSRIEACPY